MILEMGWIRVRQDSLDSNSSSDRLHDSPVLLVLATIHSLHIGLINLINLTLPGIYLRSLASVGPISSPRRSASMVRRSISARSSHRARTCSTRAGGTTTTPSTSPTIRSPGLTHRSSRTRSGTSISDARVKVLEPRMEVSLAKTYWPPPPSLVGEGVGGDVSAWERMGCVSGWVEKRS